MANLGQLGDELYAKTAQIAEVNAKVKELEHEKKEIEDKLLSLMQEAGTDIVRGATATVSISENVRPQIEDIEELYRFVHRKKAFQLFERRIAATAYREMKESLGGKAIPGLSEFIQTRLNVRKVG